MRELLITKGLKVIVDEEDCDDLLRYKWCASHSYAFNRTLGFMHRHIMKAPKGWSVDHINTNGLDNRKCNLRLCNKSQNMMNSNPRISGTSKYKGVAYKKQTGRWNAYITIDQKFKHLGYYDSQEEAAIAYNLAATTMYGEYARLNNVS